MRSKYVLRNEKPPNEGGNEGTKAVRFSKTTGVDAEAETRWSRACLVNGRLPDEGGWAMSQYCKACYLRDLRKFAEWKEERVNWTPAEGEAADTPLADDEVVFVHQDYSVTRSMWHDENIIFRGQGAAWQSFAREILDGVRSD